MQALVAALALILIGWVLWDAFETILLPRRVPARVRFSRFVVRGGWVLWSQMAIRIQKRQRRENLLGFYALLAVLGLFAVWAIGLIVGFAMLQWADGSRFAGPGGLGGFAADLYVSGTTFFTLGLGDLHPTSMTGRFLTVVESGTGFGFLALVIAYLPVLYQAFSRREARITMLDEWAGSPPTAAVLLRRGFEADDPSVIVPLLKDWEQGAAEMLESHLSYPILCYFRSQHDNQSWLASLVAILDTCSLVIVGVERVDSFQARLTFAIGRHLLVDLSQTLGLGPQPTVDTRDHAQVAELRSWLAQAGVHLKEGDEADRKLDELRAMYFPYACRLSDRLLMPLPPTLPPPKTRYNWETTAWSKTATDDAH